MSLVEPKRRQAEGPFPEGEFALDQAKSSPITGHRLALRSSGSAVTGCTDVQVARGKSNTPKKVREEQPGGAVPASPLEPIYSDMVRSNIYGHARGRTRRRTTSGHSVEPSSSLRWLRHAAQNSDLGQAQTRKRTLVPSTPPKSPDTLPPSAYEHLRDSDLYRQPSLPASLAAEGHVCCMVRRRRTESLPCQDDWHGWSFRGRA